MLAGDEAIIDVSEASSFGFAGGSLNRLSIFLLLFFLMLVVLIIAIVILAKKGKAHMDQATVLRQNRDIRNQHKAAEIQRRLREEDEKDRAKRHDNHLLEVEFQALTNIFVPLAAFPLEDKKEEVAEDKSKVVAKEEQDVSKKVEEKKEKKEEAASDEEEEEDDEEEEEGELREKTLFAGAFDEGVGETMRDDIVPFTKPRKWIALKLVFPVPFHKLRSAAQLEKTYREVSNNSKETDILNKFIEEEEEEEEDLEEGEEEEEEKKESESLKKKKQKQKQQQKFKKNIPLMHVEAWFTSGSAKKINIPIRFIAKNQSSSTIHSTELNTAHCLLAFPENMSSGSLLLRRTYLQKDLPFLPNSIVVSESVANSFITV